MLSSTDQAKWGLAISKCNTMFKPIQGWALAQGTISGKSSSIHANGEVRNGQVHSPSTESQTPGELLTCSCYIHVPSVGQYAFFSATTFVFPQSEVGGKSCQHQYKCGFLAPWYPLSWKPVEGNTTHSSTISSLKYNFVPGRTWNESTYKHKSNIIL